jgi:uncharacterized repeat protein (TIGR01451 family)
MSMNLPVPGNSYSQKIVVQNDGSAIENTVQFAYTHDGQLTYNNCTPWALTQPNSGTYPNWYRITAGFPTLNPAAGSTAIVNYNVPTNIPVNTFVGFNDTVSKGTPIGTSWLTDNTPWNNVSYFGTNVVASYDPNFKEVTPKGSGPQGFIMRRDSVLTYVVHFQNTGSYYAQNIVVVDTLDADLNISSLKPGYSDNKFSTTMDENRVVKFHFDNINLPWKSGFGDMMSSGMFSYSVKLKSNLPIGTQIKNKAAIYFDYNSPVITNETVNTLTTTVVGIEELSAISNEALLFPNPARDSFTLLLNSGKNSKGTLRMFDISGREVASRNVELQEGTNVFSENTSMLQSGIYIVRLDAEGIQLGRKLVITK